MFAYHLDKFKKNRMSKTEKILVVLILLITLGLRLYYVYTTYPPLKLSHDEVGYHNMAVQLLNRHILGYYSTTPGAFVTPGYPLFLAAVYYIGTILHTEYLVTARTVQSVISVGSVYLVYLLARKSGGAKAAVMAAAFSAVYLPSLMADNRILTEVLYTFLEMAYVYSLVLLFERDGLKWHALSGALLALAVLVRPSMAPFLVVPYIGRLILRYGWKRVFMEFLLAGIAFCLVMSPWWIRNYVVFDKFIPFATQTGNPLLRGTDPYDVYDKIGPSIIKNVPDAEMTKVAIQRIKDGLQTDPWLWIKWFTVGKLSYLWLKPWGMTAPWIKIMHLWIFVITGWVGTFVNLFDRRMRWPAIFIIIASLSQLAFIPIERYTYPLTPLMAVMAAVLLAKIVDKALDSDYLNR